MAVVQQRRAGWNIVGPGIVVAATGIGVGDLGAGLLAGYKYGYALLWAVVLGSLVKLALAEGAGRWHLASEKTIFDGWTSLGRWTHWYFAPYIVIWGFVYGATGMAVTGVPLNALFPALDVSVWGALAGILGLLFVWFNRYAIVEKAMTVLVGVMFVTVVGMAIYVAPDVPGILAGLIPTIPEGSTWNLVALIGGVGGTITMAAYGYWVNAKGWTGPSWMRVMRQDNIVAYITTGVFVLAMVTLAAAVFGAAKEGLPAEAKADDAMEAMPGIVEAHFGPFWTTIFLIGFFAAAFTSVIGVGHGVSLLFANWIDHLRKRDSLSMDKPPSVADREKDWPFRAYLLWLTFPPMIFMFALDKPSLLVMIYTVLGAVFMPFLALTLIWMLNSSRIAEEWRSKWLSNAALGLSSIFLLVVAGREIVNAIQKLIGG